MSLSSPLRVMRAIPRSRQALLPTTSRSIAVLPAASRRAFHAAPTLLRSRSQNNSKEHRPADLASLDVLASAPVPSTNIDATLPRGFMFNSGLSILDGAGALLVGGEAFEWKPWLLNGPEDDPKNLRIVNSKGQIELPAEAFSLLSLVWPRPGTYTPAGSRFSLPCRWSTANLCLSRPLRHRRWTPQPTPQPGDTATHLCSGHEGRGARHKKRMLALQPSDD
jgi:hypothetical protein